jgi:hypothetical protein
MRAWVVRHWFTAFVAVYVVVAVAAGRFVVGQIDRIKADEAAGPQLVGETPDGAKVYKVSDRFSGTRFFVVGRDGTPVPVR